MRWNLAVLAGLSFLALILSSCTSPAESVAPTPFPTAGAATSTLPAEPAALTIAEVTNALGLYQDAEIVVTGRLQRLPLLVCDSEMHPSPATWSLTDEGVVLPAAEFDQQVRQLLPDDLTMTVAGRLRRWSGPVGCGKQAQTQEVWYLEVSRILSPRTLTQATLTPSGVVETGATDVAQLPPAESPTPETPTAELPPTDEPATAPPPVSAPTAPPEAPTETPESATTPEGSPATTPLPTGTVTATVTLTGTVSGTATVTPGPGTPTATSALANATTTAGQIIDMGDVYDTEGQFPAATLGAGETHSWTLELFEDERYDIKVIAPVPADIILSLWRDGQQISGPQNQSPAGATETLAIAGQPEGTYELRVQTDAGRNAEYIMLLSIPEDDEMELLGFLAPGAPRSNVTVPELVTHYWVFSAAAGNTITLTLTPGAQSDGYLTLYGPGAVDTDTFGDGDVGQPDVLSYAVEQSGLHTVVVEDINGEEMVYSILLELQP